MQCGKSSSGSCGGLCAIRALLEDNAFNPPSIIQSDRGSSFEEEAALLVLVGLFFLWMCVSARGLQSLSNDNTPTSNTHTHTPPSSEHYPFLLFQFLSVRLLSRG